MTLPSPHPAADRLGRLAARFAAASPQLREGRELLRRVDTKYVCPSAVALDIVASLGGRYAALPVTSSNVATYRSLYFETSDLRCYHDHRRGRRLRHKIRIRHYPERQLTFLEVKSKRNEVVTDKHRVALPFRAEELGAAERSFLRQHVTLPVDDLSPVMRIDFRRLSLVGLETAERVTFDLDLLAERLDGGALRFGDLVVIEVKQAPFCVRTPIMRAVSAAGLREQAMSKYTVATAMLRPELRRNRLLADLRAIERMIP